MGQPQSFELDRTCPKCRRENVLYAETIDEKQEQDRIDSGPQDITYRYTTTLSVNVSCMYCGLLGFSTLSRFVEGGSRKAKDGSAEFWGAQDFSRINPEDAIQIVIDNVKRPKYRRDPPW
jgi:hypothetical protein